MSFEFSAEAEAFREEVRAFLDEHLTPDILERVERTGTVHDWGFYRALAERNWITTGWPAQWGGQPRTNEEVAVLWEELGLRGAPIDGFSMTTMICKTLMTCGTDEQRSRVLPLVAAGDAIICLGYTEPHSGSDVAAARTTAKRDGDEWVINGQKMFTTLAHEGTFVFLLTRTNPEVPKHDGLTMFLVPLSTPGIELSPIHTLGGERTNVTYYRDVRISDIHRVGAVDGGWKVILTALGHERTGVGRYGKNVRFLAAVRQIRDEMRAAHQSSDVLDTAIARMAIENEVSRLLAHRTVQVERGGGDLAVAGSMAKLWFSESLSRSTLALARLMGEPLALEPVTPAARAANQLLRQAPVMTIYAGTSEVQRDIIATRRLQLPRR